MKKTISKILAIILAVVFMAAASVPAMAADIDTGAITTSDTTLTIPKGVTVKNTSPGNYYGPSVTYTYTLAPVAPAAGASVSDSITGVSYQVEQGPANGATLASSSVTFNSPLVYDVKEEGVETIQNITVNIDLDKFQKPGVYRYAITDTTTTAALYAAGINRQDDYVATRYLDVYIKNSGTGLAVSGYSLIKENAVDSTNYKDTGFVSSSEVTSEAGTVNENTDIYNTYNVRLEKKVTGDMGDKNHEFPFTVSIANNGLKYFYGNSIANATNESNATTLNVTLKDGETLYIRGLNPRAEIGYTETNDTTETYNVSVEGKYEASSTAWTYLIGDATNPSTAVAANGTLALAVAPVTTYVADNDANSVETTASLTTRRDVRFTNNLASVSPTGVILRYAPYAILLSCAAVLVLVMSRRRRSESDAI